MCGSRCRSVQRLVFRASRCLFLIAGDRRPASKRNHRPSCSVQLLTLLQPRSHNLPKLSSFSPRLSRMSCPLCHPALAAPLCYCSHLKRHCLSYVVVVALFIWTTAALSLEIKRATLVPPQDSSSTPLSPRSSPRLLPNTPPAPAVLLLSRLSVQFSLLALLMMLFFCARAMFSAALAVRYQTAITFPSLAVVILMSRKLSSYL